MKKLLKGNIIHYLSKQFYVLYVFIPIEDHSSDRSVEQFSLSFWQQIFVILSTSLIRTFHLRVFILFEAPDKVAPLKTAKIRRLSSIFKQKMVGNFVLMFEGRQGDVREMCMLPC